MGKRAGLFLVALLMAAPAWAVDVYLGTVTSAGASTTNSTTASPFTIAAGARISVQCDAATYLAEGTSNSPPTVTSSNGLRVEANALFDVAMTSTTVVLGILPVSGTSNCKVFASY